MNERTKPTQWRDVSALARAAESCSRRKRGRPDAIAFRSRMGEELLALAERLDTGSYAPEPGRVFVTDRPKHREIHAAVYRDRVVHHLLHQQLEERVERTFIPDSFACRPGKGTHAAALRLQQLMWRASCHGQRQLFALQLDIRSFFMSIHKPTLLGLLRPHFHAEERRREVGHTPWSLAQVIVRQDPSRSAQRGSPIEKFAKVPPHKRLGFLGPAHGIPIGNLTSQFFANIYLSALDQFVKRTLGARNYVRYVDDFILLHPEEAMLREWEARIRRFLSERLRLEAHPVRECRPVSQGVDFVGYIVRPKYLLPRARVVHALEERLVQLEKPLAPRLARSSTRLHLSGVGSIRGPFRAQPVVENAVEALRATWASYEGHLRYSSVWRLKERLWRDHPISQRLLSTEGGKLTRRFSRSRPSESYRDQVEALSVGLRGAVLVVKVGLWAECPRQHDARALGLRWRSTRRGRHGGGVRWNEVDRLIRAALDRGQSVAVALETDGAAGNVRARSIHWLFEPLPFEGRDGQKWLLGLQPRSLSTGGRR